MFWLHSPATLTLMSAMSFVNCKLPAQTDNLLVITFSAVNMVLGKKWYS